MEHVNAEAGGCGGSRCTEVFAGGAESCGPATKRCSDSPDPARFSLSVTEGHHGHQRVQVANVRLGGGGGILSKGRSSRGGRRASAKSAAALSGTRHPCGTTGSAHRTAAPTTQGDAVPPVPVAVPVWVAFDGAAVSTAAHVSWPPHTLASSGRTLRAGATWSRSDDPFPSFTLF